MITANDDAPQTKTRSEYAHCPAIFCLLSVFALHSRVASAESSDTSSAPTATQCLPHEAGFLRAKLQGSINRELSWTSPTLECTGSVRPEGDGIRLRFNPAPDSENPLMILFGISKLHPGESGTALPVNVTVIVEGQGQFFATQNENKCTLDEVKQSVLAVASSQDHAYQVTARGFCTQPARALNGDGSILISWFDFSGRLDLDTENTANSPTE